MASTITKILTTVCAVILAVLIIAGPIMLGIGGLDWAWPVLLVMICLVFRFYRPSISPLFRILEPLFPGVKEWISQQALNTSVADKMERILSLYEIGSIDKKLYAALARAEPSIDSDTGRIAHCARMVADRLRLPQQGGTLLQFLYRGDFGPEIAKIEWEEHKNQLIPLLAQTLHKTGRPSKPEFPCSEKDMELVLQRLETFHPDALKASIERLDAFWKLKKDYIEFLKENGLRFPETSGVSSIPDVHRIEETMIEILAAEGQHAIRIALPHDSEDVVTSYTLISLALFYRYRPNLSPNPIATICNRAAGFENAVRIVLAYLEFKEDLRVEEQLDGKEFVSIDYLIKNCTRKIKEKQISLGKGYSQELHTIKDSLAQGNWPQKLSYTLEKTYRNILNEIISKQPLYDLLDQKPWLIDSLKRVFKGLTLPTVERYLEAKTINAYLLTFMSEEGTVSGLLNCLVSDEKRQDLERLGIELLVDGSPKYNFKQYTNHARIGVVPKGWSFEQFQSAFQKDFLHVIEHRKELLPLPAGRRPVKDEWNWNEHDLKDIELIVHRFGLSGRNYYGFVSSVSKKHAIEKIKELFADILNHDDLLALIEYEGSVTLTDALMQGPFIELIGNQVDLEEQQRKVLSDRDLELRNEILRVAGVQTVEELGRNLAAADATVKKSIVTRTGKALCTLLATSVYEFDEDRCRQMTTAYLDTLSAIASIAA